MTIEMIREKISTQKLRKLADASFGDMVKGVVDIQRRIVALGGELHADCEAVLLEGGSQQEDLWGFNLYLDKPFRERLEFSSFVNIRPSRGNRSMEIKDPDLRKKMREIIDSLVE